jgi:hypothetical protein
MKRTAGRTLAVAALCVTAAGCGSATQTSGSHFNPTSIQDAAAPAPAVNGIELLQGPDTTQITNTIRAFYRATWQNDDSAACSLFSPAGAAGFLQAAKVAFPDSVNQVTTCADAMRFFNADLADSADTLQQSGVNVSGNILDVVGVKNVKVTGNTATAEAPEGVEEFIAPKVFMMTREHGRWLINGSHKIGQTLAQLLAEAKAKHELVPKQPGRKK